MRKLVLNPNTVSCCACMVVAMRLPAQAPVNASPQAAIRPLVGTWETNTRSATGIGGTLLFSPDGRVTLVLGAMVDAQYRLEGSDLTFLGDAKGRLEPEVQKLTFAGDTAIFSSNSCSRRLTRLDANDSSSGIVGQWRYMHMTGVPGFDEYRPDGTMRLRVPMQVMKGMYTVAGNEIRFQIFSPRSQEWNATFAVAGDTLRYMQSGKEQRFVRARPLIPFDVEQPETPTKLICN